jgi:hypothetical protein
MLQDRLLQEVQPAVHLVSFNDGYSCEVQYGGAKHTFEALEASDAYAQALLHILKGESAGDDSLSEPLG